MAEQCIVCLGDLRENIATDSPSNTDPPETAGLREQAAGDEVVNEQQHAKSLLRDTRLSTKRYHYLLLPIPRADRAHTGCDRAGVLLYNNILEACSGSSAMLTRQPQLPPLDGLNTFAE